MDVDGSHYVEDIALDGPMNLGCLGDDQLMVDQMCAEDNDTEDYYEEDELELVGNANENFLRYLQYPDNEECLIDLQQVAVAIMSHLNRLSEPHQQRLTLHQGNMSQDATRLNCYSIDQLFYLGKSNSSEKLVGSKALLIQNKDRNIKNFVDIVCMNDAVVGLTEEGHPWWLDCDNIPNAPHFNVIKTLKMSKLITNIDGNVLLGLNETNENITYWSVPTNAEKINLTRDNPCDIFSPSKLLKLVTAYDHFIGLTEDGEVFVWQSLGILGKSSRTAEFDLTKVSAVSFSHGSIRDVACGGSLKDGTAFYLALTSSGTVYSWGDGRLGKLGLVQGEDVETPKVVDKLQGMQVVQIHCGEQFCLVVCCNGTVYTWGKSDQYRLGHGSSEDHISYPKNVEALLGRRVIKAWVGRAHAIVLTEDNKILGWGSNDRGQLGTHLPQLLRVPTTLECTFTDELGFGGLITGPSHTLFWNKNSASSSKDSELVRDIPFVLDICEDTFSLLDQLLSEVWDDGLNGRRNWPPKQEQECVAIACINLLKFQLHSYLLLDKTEANCLNKKGQLASCFQISGSLLLSIKQKVVELASNSCVLKTIQRAAQSCLQIGWSILLPTAEERARALSALLPTEIQTVNTSSRTAAAASAESGIPNLETNQNCSGRKFMIDLLVNSLMQKDSLETALMTAIRVEVQEIDQKRLARAASSEKHKSDDQDKPVDGRDALLSAQAQLETESKRTLEALNDSMHKAVGCEKSSSIPLLHLIKQLIRNAGSQTLLKLNGIASSAANSLAVNELLMNSGPSQNLNAVQTNLLLKFQRLLFAHIYHGSQVSPTCDEIVTYDGDLPGVLSLLCKYINLLSCHINEVLPVASSIAQEGPRKFVAVSSVMENELLGILLPELVLCLTFLHLEDHQLICVETDVSTLSTWLLALDSFNKLAPAVHKEDGDDMFWQTNNGLRYHPTTSRTNLDGITDGNTEGNMASVAQPQCEAPWTTTRAHDECTHLVRQEG